ncbi:P-loop NTPase fold protein [Pseudomonas fluorescens]|uniref:P-loop NTPase fold protein n=1 Tax=Pseudomonas fluorescens TaxID=294 RepID=UPI001CA7B25D|nr:P-loop NTPase fold protein [Pseudomonas fluorescens]MBY8934825.1 DUF815 domain-containing protein [Pseudomonas fluorescens]
MTESVNQNIEVNLQRYLNSKNSNQAILLTGNWGCGKTHFINSFIEKHQTKDLQLVKVSLFGLSKVSEIEGRILGFFYPFMDSKPIKLLGNSVKKVASVLKLDVFGDDKPDISLTANAEKLNLFNLLIDGKSDFALILDDIERTEIPIQELLGYINHVVETCRIKTILIANETELEKGQEESYRKFKEKVINKTFLVNHNAEDVIERFLQGDTENIHCFKSIIIETYAISDCRNLRSLKQSIDDFSQLWETVDRKFHAHEKYKILLAKTFFALSMEIKSAKTSKQQLFSENILQYGTAFTKKYFTSEMPILRESFWVDVLFNGDYSQVNPLSESLPFFAIQETPEPDTLTKLNAFQSLEDDEFEILEGKLASEIENLEDEDPLKFLRKAELMANLIANDLSNMNFTSLAGCITSYRKKHQDSDIWKNSYLDDFYRYEVSHLKSDEEISVPFESFINRQSGAYKKTRLENSKIHASNKLAGFYKAVAEGNRDTLLKLLLTDHRHTVFFTNVDIDQFVTALVGARNTAIQDFIELATERYYTDRLRSNHGSNELTLELDFWKNALPAIESQLCKVRPMKRYNLKKLIDPTIANFNRMLGPVALSDI